MKFSIDSKLFDSAPKLRVLLLRVTNIDNQEHSDPSYQLLCHEVDALRAESDSNELEASEWSKAFDKVGLDNLKPSHKALIDRVLGASELPNINPLINITNSLSVKLQTPVGAHDLDLIDGDIEVGENSENKTFTPINSDNSEEVDSDMIAYQDDTDIITNGWVWRQSDKTKITSKTTSALIPVDLLDSELKINEILELVVKVFNRFMPDAKLQYAICDINNSEISETDYEDLESDEVLEFKYWPISRDQDLIEKILEKSTEEILPSKKELERLLKSGRRLKVYQGYDPTADTLHIGHTIMMRKLEHFRKLGHEVIMLIGNFTAQIGDPTDKTQARTKLTQAEVERNLKNYAEQASAILNMKDEHNPVKVMFNNDWLGEMSFADVLELSSEFTVQQMMKRHMFQERVKDEKPIYVSEFMYPMMQGWDSVAMNIDIELGGNDQLFNMMAGRDLMMKHRKKSKFVISGKLLVTDDGKKMGKSEGNMIRLSDSAKDIYGKVMAMSDQGLVVAFELLTDADMKKVEEFKKRYEKGSDLIKLKKELAFEITKDLKTEVKAKEAEEYFEKVYQENNLKDADIAEYKIVKNKIDILEVLTTTLNFCSSKSEARRLVEQGAVRINEEKVESWDQQIEVSDSVEIKAGKQVARLVKV